MSNNCGLMRHWFVCPAERFRGLQIGMKHEAKDRAVVHIYAIAYALELNRQREHSAPSCTSGVIAQVVRRCLCAPVRTQ